MEYVHWDAHQANASNLPNPIKYTYIKDRRFANEQELRISLSAPGFEQFALKDGSMLDFPTSLQSAFDFKGAMADRSIDRILQAPDADAAFLRAELEKLGIVLGDEPTS